MTDIRKLAGALQKSTSLAEKISPAAAAAVAPSRIQPIRALATQLQPVSETGTIVLFTGTDTAAKAAAAQTLANDLHRNLVHINADSIGASINQLLGSTKSSGAILFFDEADALFGKRSGVQDSHDRYANQWQQIIEQHSGIVILAVTSTDGWNPALLAEAHATLKFPPSS